jgi:hypothetical protein
LIPERTQKLPQNYLPKINIHPGEYHTIHPAGTLVHCNPVPYLTMVNSYILTIHVHIYLPSNHQVPYLRLTYNTWTLTYLGSYLGSVLQVNQHPCWLPW